MKIKLRQCELDFDRMTVETESEERRFRLECEECKTMLELLKKHLYLISCYIMFYYIFFLCNTHALVPISIISYVRYFSRLGGLPVTEPQRHV
jgi:hypothetical protein